MKTINIQTQFSNYYSASGKPEIVEIGKMKYVTILGSGSPGTDLFYKKKKAIKDFVTQVSTQLKETEKSFESDIVEVFYWFDEKEGFVDIGDFYTTVDLDLLHYRLAILVTDFITEEDIKTTAEKNNHIPFASQIELFTYSAGKCVQLMHVGPFAGELETLPVLQNFATKNRLIKSGMHQEIHLVHFEEGQSQAHLKTILRDPVQAI